MNTAYASDDSDDRIDQLLTQADRDITAGIIANMTRARAEIDDPDATNEINQLISEAQTAVAETPTPINLQAKAGRYTVTLQMLDTGTYRIETQTNQGRTVQYDTPTGLADMARPYASQSEARAVCRDITILLRAGLAPAAVASLIF